MTMTIGVDVSQATLVWCTLGTRPSELSNEPAAIQHWLATIPVDTTVAMEATGRYHRLLAELAHRHGCRVLVLNPCDVHHYAKSRTPRAANDPVMAQVIAEYAATTAPLHRYAPAPAFVDTVRSCMRVRAGLVQHQVRLRHQAREAPQLADTLAPLLTAVSADIRAVTQHLTAQVHSEAAFACLLSIPGFGALTAAYLYSLLAVHPFATGDAFVAFLGLDLRVKDSGKLKGKRCLTKRGDPEARRLLFLAARSAARHAVPFRTIYERALAKGLSTTAAAIVVARQLARTAWSLHAHQRKYDPPRVLTQG
jgi:transposase